MAITVYNRSEVLARALIHIQQAYPGKRTDPQSSLGQEAQSLADLVGQIQQAIQRADYDGVPAYDTASSVIKSRCSAQALDNWAVTFGLPSNLGTDRVGRNGPQKATGGGGAVTGAPGTVVAAGALLTDLSGQVQVELVTGVTIPASGTIAGTFQATSAGAAGNLPAGTVLQWVAPGGGLSPLVGLTTGLSGGYDVESDLHLLERLILWLRDRPKGGTSADYRRWAEESTDAQGASLGITRAHVYPHRDGLGSEDVIITTGYNPIYNGRRPTDAVRTACQAYIDKIRPVNDTPTVVQPYYDLIRGLSIEYRVVPTAEYPWDWTLPTGSTSVPLGSPNTTTKIKIRNSDLQAGGIAERLRQAFENGTKPRVQIVLPESPLPQVVSLVSATNIGVGLFAEFTLDGTLTSSPALDHPIYPAGGHVRPVALAVLDYIGHIGPSKQCGFYDNITDDWEAVVSIGKLAWAALDAEDSIGAKYLVYSPSVGQGVGIKVAVGAAPAAAADVQLFDNLPPHTIGPELPWVKSILVLPVQ